MADEELEEEAPTVSIIILTITKDQHTVQIHENDTIKQLKDKIKQVEGTPPKDQVLRFMGKELSNSATCGAEGAKVHPGFGLR